MIRELLVFESHGRHAQAVAFTADGQYLVSAGRDAMIRLWRVPDFQPVGVLAGHRNSVNSLSLSPAGDRLATCSSDGTSKVWSFPEGRILHTLKGQRQPRWSPDGRLLTTLSRPGRVAHWEGTTCQPLADFAVADRRLFCLAFSPHPEELLVGGTGTIHRLRMHDGAPMGQLTGHGVAVVSMGLSPDGGVLASTGAEGEVRFWDSAGWQILREVPLRAGGMLQLAWMPAGNRVAVACDHVIQLVPLREGEPIERLEAGIKGLYGLGFSPDGRWLANAGADGKLRLWRFAE